MEETDEWLRFVGRIPCREIYGIYGWGGKCGGDGYRPYVNDTRPYKGLRRWYTDCCALRQNGD